MDTPEQDFTSDTRREPGEVRRLLSQCRWPSLEEPYHTALVQAVTYILDRVPDLLGIIASGSIVRGTPALTSDLDIYAIHSRPVRQRVQRWFNSIPAEIFVNPPDQIPRYIEREHTQARPITAHMISTGFIVIALDPVIEELQAIAAAAYAKPPDPSPERLTSSRYMAAAHLEDGLDMLDERPETAKMILTLAVYDMLHYRFLEMNRFRPRDKDLLTTLEVVDADLATLAHRFFQAQSLSATVELAKRIADRTIQTYGFFEWASTPERLPAADDGQAQDKDPAQRTVI